MTRQVLKRSCFVPMLILSVSGATAACEFAVQGEGHVAQIIDARTIRLDDGRDVRLAGLEMMDEDAGRGRDALARSVMGREVTLHGTDDRPDRYGQQIAFVAVKGASAPVQLELVAQGIAAASPAVTDRACLSALLAAEGTARAAKRGIWGSSIALKNAERPDDILARTGRFSVVEGTVLSARPAGAVFYLNFGRRWTRDFAVTISKRMMPSFAAAGIDLNSLTGKKIRVRGWIERRGGPRIEARLPGQIEMVAAADPALRDSAAGMLARDEGK